MGGVPIDTSTRQFSAQAKQDGLHVVELFGGIGLGVLRAALAANFKIRCYTYVDKDITSRRIAQTTLSALWLQYFEQLPAFAVHSFDKKLPQDISQCTSTFLEQLISSNGPVDLLGGSWECQSVSRAGRPRGADDPRSRFFYDLVRILNFCQLEQKSPPVYIPMGATQQGSAINSGSSASFHWSSTGNRLSGSGIGSSPRAALLEQHAAASGTASRPPATSKTLPSPVSHLEGGPRAHEAKPHSSEALCHPQHQGRHPSLHANIGLLPPFQCLPSL